MSISTTSCACSQERPGAPLYRCLLLLQDSTAAESGPLCLDCAEKVGRLSLLEGDVKDYEVAPWVGAEGPTASPIAPPVAGREALASRTGRVEDQGLRAAAPGEVRP
jgi:hypothetical protein